VFLGTPHRGSWIADWAKIPASALAGTQGVPNAKLLKVLRTDDQFLEDIQKSFWEMVRYMREDEKRKLEVASFFEEIPLPVIGKPIVPPQSAVSVMLKIKYLCNIILIYY